MTTDEPDPLAAHEFILRTTSDGILITDAGLFLTVINPAACAMLGFSPEEALGRRADALFTLNPPLVNLFTRKEETRQDVRLPRRRLAQGLGATLSDQRRIVILQEVTETRDLEERREALTRAIAHDLRNPVSAISGFMDLVQKSGELNDLQRKFLTRARQTANKINDMLHSLVDLAWIEAGMPLEHVPIRLDETIKACVTRLEQMAHTKGVGIVLSLQTPLPVVTGDPNRLALAIYHILHNALLYTVAKETNIVIHAWSDDHEIYCNVADQGIGIDDPELMLIFDRMYRGRDERVTELHGGGLGLTIARTIIKRHGGDIWASSNINHGTTISFMLPIVRPVS